MITVTAAEVQKHFGKYRDLALQTPVAVTHHGRESLVLLSAEAYRRLKSFDDREVYLAKDIPGEWREALENSDAPAWTSELDHLMDP